jgi:peptidoglycan pentaglycine glycine transferase (the first glycine)
VTTEWMTQYCLLESSRTEDGLLSIWHSPGKDDDAWDEFLMKTPMGQFQQSSMWAQVKEVDGWECLRVVATIEDRIAGGFQVLWRDTRFGRIGYVSKGPIAGPETPNLVERLVTLMQGQALNQRILALVVQPPDDSQITSDILGRHHFIKSNPMGVIEATLLIDVSKGHNALEKGMNRNSRRRVRLAKQCGIVIRECSIDDIGLFFNLMSETCKRQGVSPNPGSVDALGQLWRTFSKHNLLRVFFAEYDHEVVGGLLNITFGKKVSLWKKGWNFKGHACYPNDLLYYETLHWACSNQFDHCDLASLDPTIADAMLRGMPLSETQQKTRDMFNIRFGGTPKILPPARIWIANPFIRSCYEHLVVRLGLPPLIIKSFR